MDANRTPTSEQGEVMRRAEHLAYLLERVALAVRQYMPAPNDAYVASLEDSVEFLRALSRPPASPASDEIEYGFTQAAIDIDRLQQENARLRAQSVPAPAAAGGVQVPAGWKLVPVEPTEEMVAKAIWQSHNYPVVPHGYEHKAEPLHHFVAICSLRAAIAAAPAAPPAKAAPAVGRAEIIERLRARADEMHAWSENDPDQGYFFGGDGEVFSAMQVGCAEAAKAMRVAILALIAVPPEPSVAGLRSLSEAATPGPWLAGDGLVRSEVARHAEKYGYDEDCPDRITTARCGNTFVPRMGLPDEQTANANADFIAASVNYVRSLLACGPGDKTGDENAG